MQGYAPHFGFGAKPALEDGFFGYNYFFSSAVIDVDFLIVADCDITRLGKFISAQEVFVGEGGGLCTQSVLAASLGGGVLPLWILGFCGRLLQQKL